MTRTLAILISILGVLLGAPRSLAQNSIELRSSARLSAGSPLTLAEVASLRGAEAEALAGVIVVPESATHDPNATAITLTLEHLRQAIDQTQSVNWGSIMLRGSRCTVLPPAAAPARRETPKPAPRDPDAPIASGTIRSAVQARAAQIAQVDPDDLRLNFDERDAETLDTPIAGRTLEVNATAISDKLPVSIALFQGDRTILSKSIRVGVQVKRTVLKSRSVRRKGDVVAESDVETLDQWMPMTSHPATSEQVIGAVVQSHVGAGEIFMDNDVAAPLATQKGEIVAVRVLSGSVSLATKGRAMGPAREGELVRLQALDSKREFIARMDGKGRAVIVAGQTPIDLAEARPGATPRSKTRSEFTR
jgi:flagella basal body P-ring formation protein FlgA